MIFGYFDESGLTNEAFSVVAGFLGRKDDWKKFLKLWRKEMGTLNSVHLADLRLASSQAVSRYGDLLRRLGSVPNRANLLGFAGSVPIAYYAKQIKGTIADIGLAGYNVALVAMIDAILESRRLPKREQIEFIFEDQVEYAIQRAAMFHHFRQADKYKTCHGRSRVGKDSSMAKSTLLEASDYLAYAILQQLIDPNSQKALLTAPILEQSKPLAYTVVDKNNVDYLLESVYDGYGTTIPTMDRRKRRFLLSELQRSIKES